MIVSMQTHLKQPEPDYNLINDKLKNFITVSEKYLVEKVDYLLVFMTWQI